MERQSDWLQEWRDSQKGYKSRETVRQATKVERQSDWLQEWRDRKATE